MGHTTADIITVIQTPIIIPTFKTNKQKLYIEMESFFRLVKLKTHFDN